MANVLFISEAYLKENTNIDENVDVKEIIPSIVDAQEMHLLPCLGSALYEDLKTKIAAVTTNSDEDTLISSYIAPMLVKFVQMELSTDLLYKYRDKGVMKKSSENSSSVSYTDMRYLMDRWDNKAQFYKKRLIDYLCGNTALFPTYLQSPNAWDIIPDTNAFTNPFYLGTESWDEKKQRLKLRGSL